MPNVRVPSLDTEAQGDTEGVQHYVSRLGDTMVRDAVIEQMLDSNERKALANATAFSR
jgi:hypothetical protein